METIKKEILQKTEYEVEIKKDHKSVSFEIKNSKGKILGIATLELKKTDSCKKHYHLKDINSFVSGRGIAKAILKKMGKFIQEEDATASGVVWGRRKLKLFTDAGWISLENPNSPQKTDKITIIYGDFD